MATVGISRASERWLRDNETYTQKVYRLQTPEVERLARFRAQLVITGTGFPVPVSFPIEGTNNTHDELLSQEDAQSLLDHVTPSLVDACEGDPAVAFFISNQAERRLGSELGLIDPASSYFLSY